MGEIINLELIKEHKEKEGTLEVVKESLDIALNYYSVEGDHYKAQILLNIPLECLTEKIKTLSLRFTINR